MMVNGGIWDYVGQGFYCYFIDCQWYVFYFEKMLYDQVQFVVVYLQVFQIFGDEFYFDVVKGILQYVVWSLSYWFGGFYSVEDVDLFLEWGMWFKEGVYYVWVVKEVQQFFLEFVLGVIELLILGQFFMKYYGFIEVGNISFSQDFKGELQGQNVLIVWYLLELIVVCFGLDVEVVWILFNIGLEKFFQVWKYWFKLYLDSKMLVVWNGLMVLGYVVIGVVLG